MCDQNVNHVLNAGCFMRGVVYMILCDIDTWDTNAGYKLPVWDISILNHTM